MTLLEEIRRLYEEYFAEFQQLEQNRRLGAGAFGLSGGPRDYPCHQRFAGDLERLLQRAENIPSDEAAHILDYIWFAPQAREDRQDAVYWMLTAVHGMTAELAGRLSSPPGRPAAGPLPAGLSPPGTAPGPKKGGRRFAKAGKG